MFSNEFRISYYLNNINKHYKIDIINKYLYFSYDKLFLINKTYIEKHRTENYYFNDFHYYSTLFKDSDFLFTMFGDNILDKYNFPYITKVRQIKDNNSNSEDKRVILNLDRERHSLMLPHIKIWDKPFYEKDNKLLWRGGSTGFSFNPLRNNIVKKYQNHPNTNFDIKFTELVQGYNNDNNEYVLGKYITYDEQLKSKFLISIEGNDVASNLKWMLYSNSVVLMPKPKICSWFMEDHLAPFVHYIPLQDDFEDLEDKYQWCLNNLDKCLEISKNATQYIEQFMDEQNELYITKNVIDEYLKCISIDNIELVKNTEYV